MTPGDRETYNKLVNDYGFTHLYPEDKFYNTHKLSRAEFLGKLERAQTQ